MQLIQVTVNDQPVYIFVQHIVAIYATESGGCCIETTGGPEYEAAESLEDILRALGLTPTE